MARRHTPLWRLCHAAARRRLRTRIRAMVSLDGRTVRKAQRTLWMISPLHAQSQNVFFDLRAARIGKVPVLADTSEPAFFQNAARADIVFDNTGINGAHRHLTQEH